MTNGYRFLAAFLRSPSFFKPQGAAAEKIWLTPDCASSSLTAVGSSLVVGFTAARRLPTAAHSQRSPSPLARAFARRYRSSRPAPPPLSASSSPSLASLALRPRDARAQKKSGGTALLPFRRKINYSNLPYQFATIVITVSALIFSTL